MSNRLKKDATESLEKLQDYLRRDVAGSEMLKKIDRYSGYLRQELSTTRASLEDVLRLHKIDREVIERIAEEDRVDKHQLHKLTARVKQLESDLANAKAELSKRETSNEFALESIVPSDLFGDDKRKFAMAKELRKRLPRPPIGRKVCSTHFDFPCRVFPLNLIVDDCSGDNLMLIGMIVFVMTSFGMPVAFENPDFEENKYSGDKCRIFTSWIDDWIEPISLEEERIASRIKQGTLPDNRVIIVNGELCRLDY